MAHSGGKATSSSRKVSHSGSKLNSGGGGRCVSYRESLGARAIESRKIATDTEMMDRARSKSLFWKLCILFNCPTDRYEFL
jgi:hypothetical protein